MVEAYRFSCFPAYGIFPDQGLSLCLHWQVDSSPLNHQGSPSFQISKKKILFWNMDGHILFITDKDCVGIFKYNRNFFFLTNLIFFNIFTCKLSVLCLLCDLDNEN